MAGSQLQRMVPDRRSPLLPVHLSDPAHELGPGHIPDLESTRAIEEPLTWFALGVFGITAVVSLVTFPLPLRVAGGLGLAGLIAFSILRQQPAIHVPALIRRPRGTEISSFDRSSYGLPGGNGFGGGVYISAGTASLIGAIVTLNAAMGGAGGTGFRNVGAPGQGEGGGLFIDTAALVCLDAVTQAGVSNNTASTKDPNIHGPWRPC